MKIIAIIATKNRINLLYNAIYSARNQTRVLDELIVVSDSSTENFDNEEKICQKFNCTLLKNKYANNYAGSLNTAIHKIIYDRLSSFDDLSNLYIAILDDDDTWESNYIEKASETINNNEDFVLSGINLYNDKGITKPPIKTHLSIDDFLKGNPYIQGSNTFVKLSTLLKCGLFDENMESAVDRDLFVRIMMLRPKFSILNEHLVNISIGSHERITTNYSKKLLGLKHFYYKYSGMMNKEVENHFFERIKNLFNVEKTEVLKFDKYISIENVNKSNKLVDSKKHKLLIGFIVTDYDLGIRLLKQLIELNRFNTRILIFLNFNVSKNEYENLLKNSLYPHSLITLEKIHSDYLNNKLFGVTFDINNDKTVVKDISISRSILQHYLYEYSYNDETIWIIDEDMELKELIIQNNQFIFKPINIDEIISIYKGKFDAAIGKYCLDPPLPLMSTLRTSLLDYVYNKFSSPQTHQIMNLGDYYYDLSDNGNKHLETPLKIIDNKEGLDLIFSGKATTRPLFMNSNKNIISDAKNRGGNAFIFNKELLKLPNWSISIKNKIGRRSDYFWVLLAKNNGYQISSIPHGLTHNRNITIFDYQKEEDKLLKDIIGSSFTKTIEVVNIDTDDQTFFNIYKNKFNDRLTKYICSYFRIIGLLEILDDEKYLKQFSLQKLDIFINNAQSLICFNTIKQEFENFNKNLLIHAKKNLIKKFEKDLTNYFKIKSWKILGHGKEGIIYTDNKNVYKCFFQKPNNWDSLKELNFDKCDQLYPIKTYEIKDFFCISYEYNESTPYDGGHTKELANLIRFAKQNGFIFTNIKKENFIILNKKIKMIDYGSSIETYSYDGYLRSVKRAYQMLRYSFLNNNDFKELTSITYSCDKHGDAINYGFENFLKIIENRSKEEIHDDLVLKLIDIKNKKILDYGAGRCNIANLLSKNNDVSVFDIDIKTIEANALEKINIMHNVKDNGTKIYDLIICNLVLCCTTNEINEEIINNISNLLKINGRIIISICNPFFNEIKNSEICNKINFKSYHESCVFEKKVNSNNNMRTEFHRPIEYYINLLNRNGIHIDNVVESDGVDFDNLMPISEHIIFDCILKYNNTKINDCSLLIKTNPMEYKNIYKQITHIVCTMEKNISFFERIVTVDASENIVRVRKYSNDNLNKLIDELNKAKANHLIDKIIFAKNDIEDIENTYNYWFNSLGCNTHSLNGQAIYATLKGFNEVKTPYVFQTDSDIIYSINSTDEIILALNIVRDGAISSSLSIPRKYKNDFIECARIEVRSSFLNLHKLKDIIPLENSIKNNVLCLSWNRSLEKKIKDSNIINVRFFSDSSFFIHPQNNIKGNTNIISYARNSMSKGFFPENQLNNIDLVSIQNEWIKKIDNNIILYIRGHNTSNSKIKRLLDSIRTQNNKNFHIIYLDDASTNASGEYAKFILENDNFFKNKITFIENEINLGILSNLITSQNIIVNENAIIINIDNNDCLMSDASIERIVSEFNKGADLTCGNCLRYDKPTKQYNIISFDKLWERKGDNIWLHPKCFLRKLFNCVDIEKDLKINGEYIDVNADFAFMLPMIRNASKSMFIKDIIYYFEPLKNTINKFDKYTNSYKEEIKSIVLDRYKNKFNGFK